MPFKQGQGGRPTGARNRVSKDARDVFVKLGGPDGKRYAEELHALATAPGGDVHVRIKALSIIAPYLWGRPTERVELGGAGGGPLLVTFVDA